MRWNNSARAATLWAAVSTLVIFFSLGLIWSQTSSSSATSATASPGQSRTQTPAPQPSPPSAAPLVMIDPAHGGAESGAVLNPVILEKDVTLAFARRLRQDLTSRGVLIELVRDADVSLSTDDRAAKANAEHPALYVCLHASSQSNGINIFSAMLPEAGDARGTFVDWETAQAASLPSSRAAQQQIVATMQKSGIPARSLMAPLLPLNNVVAPAIGVEISPSGADVSQLISPDYQQTISTALATAITSYFSSPVGTSGNPQ